MASRSLGQLTLSLVAEIGGFTAGMSKAEREADNKSKAIAKSLQGISVASVAVGTAIGSVLADGIRAAANAFPALIEQAASFADIADKTGGSAEGFANFAVSAKVAGVEMETIATASTKLSKALFDVDEESKGAVQGLKALGIDLQTIQALKPDEQIKLVANAFGQFADGANKAAVAQQIFGKSGAELLKFFKDYVDNGGDVNILTAEMIQKADDFADAQARLRAELGLMASAIATNFIDPLNALITIAKEAAVEVYNMDSAAAKVGVQSGIKQFAEDTGRALAGAIDYVKQSVREFQVLIDFVSQSAKAVRQLGDLNFAGAAQTGADFRAKYGLDELGRKIGGAGQEAARTYVQRFNDELSKQARSRFAAVDPRRLDGGAGGDTRPQLRAPTVLRGGGGGRRSGGGSAATRQSEAERYLQSLQKQLEKTNELSTQEQVLQDIQMGRLGSVTAAQKEQLLSIAGQIDANKQIAEQEKERLKVEQEAAKARKALMDEGAALTEANRAPIEVFIDSQRRVKELLDAGAISADTYSREMKRLGTAFTEADQPIKDTANSLDEFAKNAAENIQRSLGDNLVDAMNGNFKSIGDSFFKMLQRMAAEAVAADITRGLFGSNAKGGEGSGILGDLLKAFGGSFGFGGARAAGGPVMPNTMYRVNERGPEVFQAANGEQYLMTGNASGRVIPNGGGMNQTLNINVVGLPDSRTATQIAQEARRRQNQATARMA